MAKQLFKECVDVLVDSVNIHRREMILPTDDGIEHFFKTVLTLSVIAIDEDGAEISRSTKSFNIGVDGPDKWIGDVVKSDIKEVAAIIDGIVKDITDEYTKP